MIQTGHSNGNSTPDERKILANTLYYLKQKTEKTSIIDNGAQDFASPDAVENIINENEKLTWDNVNDNGTTYTYYVRGYDENGNQVSENGPYTANSKTGIKGYYYTITSSPEIIKDITNTTFTNNSSITMKYEYMGKYLNIVAVDSANNLSETTSILLD